MAKRINIGEYCHCLQISSMKIGEGKILGCHIIIGDADNGCGGYITDVMLKEHNPKHPRIKEVRLR